MDSVATRQLSSDIGDNCCIDAIRMEGELASKLGLEVKAFKEDQALRDCVNRRIGIHGDVDDERIDQRQMGRIMKSA
jgi:hypothetical protein